jgi:hypothetical protein
VDTAIAAIVTIALLYFILRPLVAVARPIRVSADGTRLVGRRGWRVHTITGRIASIRTRTERNTTSTWDSVNQMWFRNTVTETFHDVLVHDASGTQRSFTVNGDVRIFHGQVVSYCWARRGRRSAYLGLLNHSANQTWPAPEKDALGLVQRTGCLFVCWVFLLGITLVGLIVPFTFIIVWRIQYRRFRNKGIRSLWPVTAPAVARVG